MSSSETKTETEEPETTQTKPVAEETAPVEKGPELPKFEKDLSNKITEKFGSKTEIVFVKPDRIRVNVKKEDIINVASYIRDELKL